METPTSPKFPLPAISAFFPRPVEIVRDNGTALGSIRQVKFVGREGAGDLTWKVMERTDTKVVYVLQSDTTPYKGWIGFQRVIYQVEPEGDGTRLQVSIDFERKLSPAWVFSPMMHGVTKLAMQVLVSDVKQRSEKL
jgi:hypothetical protein